MRHVVACGVAGATLTASVAAAGAVARIFHAVQRGGGEHDLLRDAVAGYGQVVGGADGAGLPLHPEAAEAGHARSAAGERRGAGTGVPERDRAAGDACARSVGAVATVVRSRGHGSAGSFLA